MEMAQEVRQCLVDCSIGMASIMFFQSSDFPHYGELILVLLLYCLSCWHLGWGIGGQRELTPEEFARGDRSYFEGYQTKQQGDFINQIWQEKEDLKRSELEELLGVAKIAGINFKDPSKRLNKFEADVMKDDDDLDLSV
jgi:hypothetical protein